MPQAELGIRGSAHPPRVLVQLVSNYHKPSLFNSNAYGAACLAAYPISIFLTERAIEREATRLGTQHNQFPSPDQWYLRVGAFLFAYASFHHAC